jgi:outer membrane protein assembly factor BamE (lipoprotein component of BamABCDE complex)
MKNFLAAFFILILSSCVSRLEKHGYMFDMSDHEMVQEGVTSKDRVLTMMGSPTLVTNFDDEVWIYYSEDVRHFLFFDPKIVDRKIMVLRFDKNNLVSELKNFGLDDDKKDLKFAENKTPVSDHERGIFKSFFANVGQIKPVQ